MSTENQSTRFVQQYTRKSPNDFLSFVKIYTSHKQECYWTTLRLVKVYVLDFVLLEFIVRFWYLSIVFSDYNLGSRGPRVQLTEGVSVEIKRNLGPKISSFFIDTT